MKRMHYTVVTSVAITATLTLWALHVPQCEAQAAVARAEAAQGERAEAGHAAEAMRQDQERRARVFNTAVQAAVQRVQQKLEAERSELQVGAAGSPSCVVYTGAHRKAAGEMM